MNRNTASAAPSWTQSVAEHRKPDLRSALWQLGNTLVLLGLAPFYLFLIHYRFPSRKVGRRERNGVYWTNGALAMIVLGMSLTLGFEAYVLIQLPVIVFAATAGVWLFYVQHQFENVRWERREDWDHAQGALRSFDVRTGGAGDDVA